MLNNQTENKMDKLEVFEAAENIIDLNKEKARILEILIEGDLVFLPSELQTYLATISELSKVVESQEVIIATILTTYIEKK
jgi:hypothetical protein